MKLIVAFYLIIYSSLAGATMQTSDTIRFSYYEDFVFGDFKTINLEKKAWKTMLTKDQYSVMWDKGTEVAFSGPLNNEYREGFYSCASCHNLLFSSDDKYNSGTGWPSFTQAIGKTCITLQEDLSLLFMPRVEVLCARCGAHLGHVFDDGPYPTYRRFCMNSVAMYFTQGPKKIPQIQLYFKSIIEKSPADKDD